MKRVGGKLAGRISLRNSAKVSQLRLCRAVPQGAPELSGRRHFSTRQISLKSHESLAPTEYALKREPAFMTEPVISTRVCGN